MDRYSVKKLNRLARTNEIWCFGCGKRFYDMLASYEDEPFVKKLHIIIDNNRLLWDRTIIGSNKITVKSPDALKNIQGDGIVLIITSDAAEEIANQIKEYSLPLTVKITTYPREYYGFTKYIMALCSLLPMKRQMIFRAGREPHENADALVEYMADEYKGKKYKVLYLAEKNEYFNIYDKNIEYLDIDTLKHKASMRSIINFCKEYSRTPLLFYENTRIEKVRNNQKLIFLNHGMIPLKYVADVLRQPADLDHAVCPAKSCAAFYEEQYGIPEEKLIFSMLPRTAAVFEDNTGRIDGFLNSRKMQVLLWLPTFRRLEGSSRTDSADRGVFDEFLKEDVLSELNDRLRQNNQKLVIKFHPRERDKIKKLSVMSNISILEDSDIRNAKLMLQHFLGRADALLTDYSSIAFEYMLTDRPIGYVIRDLENYSRGFSVEEPLVYMPGEKIYTFDALTGFMENVKKGNDIYAAQRHELIKRLFDGADPTAGAKDLMNFLEEI